MPTVADRRLQRCAYSRRSATKAVKGLSVVNVLGHIFADSDKLLQVGNTGFVIISMLNYYGPVDASIDY